MELVGLDRFFTLPGAFGDESHNRRDLPAKAAERIREHLQIDLAPEQFIVIGDTPERHRLRSPLRRARCRRRHRPLLLK
jgi:hypothetical protein